MAGLRGYENGNGSGREVKRLENMERKEKGPQKRAFC